MLARETPVPAVDELPWGTHCCQLVRSRRDLLETLVPYFDAGLRRHEACLWIAAPPLDAAAAEAAMIDAVPAFADRVAAGQIAIRDADDWYAAERGFDGAGALTAWLEQERRARQAGYAGLRLAGNASWLARGGWDELMAHERGAQATFHRHRVRALCTYDANRCTTSEVQDLARCHDFVLERRGLLGPWDVVRAPPPAAGAGGSARRVLVVDDNADAAESLVMLLELMGHRASMALDGQAAITLAAGIAPDVVLLDVALPDMTGYEVARRLREQPATRDAFLVALTGYGREEDRRHALEAGFDRHVLKPLDPDALDALLAVGPRPA